MISSNIKKEEYRTIKSYWKSRFLQKNGEYKNYDYIIFKNGYGKNSPSVKVKCNGIRKGFAVPEWSDNWQGEVFIIDLGEII